MFVCVCLFVLDSPGNDCLHGNHTGKKSAARLDIHVCGHVSTSYQTAEGCVAYLSRRMCLRAMVKTWYMG